ncbi:MAG: InlB B-repeat-containing protein [Candidatus Methanomethylophilus sp.]|nr:InlB B-repeat-containing protein [Methanomethylophilus sp.]
MVSAATKIGIPAGAILAVFVMFAAGASMASAEVDNDQGTVSYYTYTVDFAFKGTDAQTILWDFGFDNPDGTRATSDEWNPQGIVFPAKGLYTVTQIVSNTVGTYTSQLKIEILGTPEITFVTDGGTHIPVQVVKLGQRVTVPETPVKEGYDFGGWFTDSACTERYDFNNGVTGHTTLYAKWTPSSGSSDTGGENDKDNGNKDGFRATEQTIEFDWKLIGLLIGGLIVIGLLRRK